jgi:hypothetical protein
MPASPSSSDPGGWPGLEAFAAVEVHAGFVILFLVAGAVLWLGDGFLSERADVDRDMQFGQMGLPDLDRERIGRSELREVNERTFRVAGKGAVAIGAVLALVLAVRLLF